MGTGKGSSSVATDDRGHGSCSELRTRLGDLAGDLDLPICTTCSCQITYDAEGNLDLEDQDTPYKCPICADPRQYIGVHGQKWTTLPRLLSSSEGYKNEFEELIPGQVWIFRTVPAFGIGQRAFLIKDPSVQGLVMWDCVCLFDDATLSKIDQLSNGNGISHMVVSHPHYFSTTAVWAAAYPDMKLWLAEIDFFDWYQRQDVKDGVSSGTSQHRVSKQIRFVKDEQTALSSEAPFTILLLGGHFPGSLVLLWKDALFMADTIQVVPSGMYRSQEPQREGVVSVSFLWSYPNQIPLSAAEIKRVCAPLEKVEFSKAFGAFANFNIWGHAKEKILQSRDIFCQRLSVE